MLEIKINNTSIDLFKGQKIDFEFKSPAFLGGDPNIIQGVYSIPVSIPSTCRNKKLFGYPDYLDNCSDFIENIDAEIYVCGNLWLKGKATIKEATKDAYKFTFVSSTGRLSTLKDKFTDDILDKNIYDGLTGIGIINLMNNSLNGTESFYFFPQINSFNNIALNGWDAGIQSFNLLAPIRPFFRVDYILKEIISFAGLEATGAFLNDPQIKQLVLHNNSLMERNIDDGGGGLITEFKNYMNPGEYTPNILVSDFLKEIAQSFCLGIFTDFKENKVHITPLKSLLNQEPKDWTSKTNSFVINTGSNEYDYFAHTRLEEEKLNEIFLTPKEGWNFIGEFLDLSDLPIGNLFDYAFVANENLFYFTSIGGWTRLEQKLGDINLGNTNPIELRGQPLYQKLDPTISLPDDNVAVYSSRFQNEAEKSKAIRLIQYRGKHTAQGGQLYPFANSHNYNFNKQIAGPYSYFWHGANGLYETWWKPWNDFLKRSRTVSATFTMKIADILDIDLRDKINIDGNLFFISRATFSVATSTRIFVKAELIQHC